MNTSVVIAIESPRSPEVEELLRLGSEHLLGQYALEDTFLLSSAELDVPAATVYVARVDGDAAGSGRAVGMVALVRHDDVGLAAADAGLSDPDALAQASDALAHAPEVKRMFVRAESRGLGVADRLLTRLENDAAGQGLRRIVLETGRLQDAAIRLYLRHGFVRVANFGPYAGKERSICFAKEL